MMDTLWQDIRYGVRMLAKSPGFTIVAVLALALGVGANTAIFSVVNAVLLRPLPFEDPDRLVLVWGNKPQTGWPQLPLSFPNFTDLKDQSQLSEEIGAWSSYTQSKFNVTIGDEPEQIQYALVTANFFSVLGIQPILGRVFSAEDDKPGGPRVIVVSQSLWQRCFGSQPGLMGKTLALEGQSYQVIGVMPSDFKFVSFPREAEIWLPLALDPLDPTQGKKYARGMNSLGVIARLKRGVTLPQVQTEVNTIARRLEAQYPYFNRGWGLKVIPLHEQVVINLRRTLLVLFGAVGFVLSIACANVANLLLAQARARQREIAIRAALGASRLRLVRQLLIESVLLAVLGGTAGVLLAFWGIDLLAFLSVRTASPFIPYDIPREQIGVDGQVLGFTFALSLLTGLICGLVPALQATKSSPNDSLKEGGIRPAGGPSHNRARSLLVVSEVALSLTLMIGAGLMIRSFMRLREVDPGFRPENVWAIDINLPRFRYPEGHQVAAFYQQLLERLEILPGVHSVGAATLIPMSGADSSTGFFIEGEPIPRLEDKKVTHYRSISPDYFRALGITLSKGRHFTKLDTKEARRVAIINETMARRFWPSDNPLGKRLALDMEAMKFYPNKPPDLDIASGLREIVGIVADVKHSRLDAEPVPEMYVPYPQRPWHDMTVVARYTSDPTSLASAVRREILAIDKDQPISNINTMSQLLSGSVARPRFNVQLLAVFAAVALILTVMGVYGVTAYAVSQRTHEIGIRMALGAQQRQVFKLVVGQGMLLAVMGVLLGLGLAFAVTRVLSGLLYGISATDPVTFVVISLLLSAVSLLACYIPARKAMKVDPMVALRNE